jgi:hypothetical protein
VTGAGATSRAGGNSTRPETKAWPGDPNRALQAGEKEFIQVARIADLDPKAKARAGGLREEMKQVFGSPTAP